jgi:1,4-dihydroxy-2-naphthoate octaprenyltransferase
MNNRVFFTACFAALCFLVTVVFAIFTQPWWVWGGLLILLFLMIWAAVRAFGRPER